jgi:hypothetical protein
MKFDTTVAIWFAAVIAIGGGMFAYRAHLQTDAHWITKVLCEDRPAFSGKFKECLEHYAPASARDDGR